MFLKFRLMKPVRSLTFPRYNLQMKITVDEDTKILPLMNPAKHYITARISSI